MFNINSYYEYYYANAEYYQGSISAVQKYNVNMRN